MLEAESRLLSTVHPTVAVGSGGVRTWKVDHSRVTSWREQHSTGPGWRRLNCSYYYITNELQLCYIQMSSSALPLPFHEASSREVVRGCGGQ